MRHSLIDSSLFIKNRKDFCKRMLPDAVAIINPNDEFPRNGDQDFPFRQNSDLFYLTGIDQEKTRLILAPDFPNKKHREILFILETSEKIETWEGPKHTRDEASKLSGISTVLWLDEFEPVLNEIMVHVKHVYLNTNENPKYNNPVPYLDLRFANELRNKFPNHDYKRAAPVLYGLRMVKKDIEIELIKKAVDITGNAFRKILQVTRPGIYEYEIQAELEYEFTRNRAGGNAYRPIIASGERACVLHYINNDGECRDGELLLMDFGAEYANYAADLSRTIPVNGKFTKRQRECYDAVLSVQKKAIKMFIPGNTIDNLNKEVNKLMEKEMIRLGLFTGKDVKNQDPENPMHMKYYMHGASHFMGLDVHDVGLKSDVFKPGMVLTCEPGLYIKKEKIGIRIENDIFITKNGPVNLMKDIPVDPEEIEHLMNIR